MPSLVLTGHPCAGKTTLANLIRERALLDSCSGGKIQKVVLINEETTCPDHTKSACYRNSHVEKKTRAALKAAFDRTVSAKEPGVLVILDSMNYIKGFRYELHCISKAANELHGIVWVLNDVEVCKEWNQKRQAKEEASSAFTDEQMQALVMRYEPPDARNRWDHPLYRMDVRPQQENASSNTAKDALDRSVYNMHKLSDAIDRNDVPAAAASGTGEIQEASATAAAQDPKSGSSSTTTTAAAKTTAAKKTSAFKKSAFKRRTKTPKESTAKSNSLESSSSTTATTTAKESTPPVTTPTTTTQQQQQLSLEERVDQMLEAFLSQKPLAEGLSTRQHFAANADGLHTVDAVTNRVCSSLIAAVQKNQSAATVVVTHQYQVAYSSTCSSKVLSWKAPPANNNMSLSMLKRLRRQYIAWVQNCPPEDLSELGVAMSFLEYIAQSLEKS